MPLTYRTLLITCGALALYLGVVYVIEQAVILPGFVKLERQGARQDIGRCVEALESELEHLNTFCHDWSAWDDTYRFVADHNPEYIAANLVPATFDDASLDIVYLCDRRGRVVWGRIYDRQTWKLVRVPELPPDALPPDHPLLGHKTTSDVKVGVFLTARGPLLVASRPIVTTDEGGPIRGALIMGRFLTPAFVEALARQTKVHFVVWSVRDRELPADARRELQAISAGDRSPLRTAGPHHLYAYTAFPGVDGSPALVLRADVPRDVTAGGRASVHFALLAIGLASLLSVLVAAALLNRTVLWPVARLSHQVAEIGRRGEAGARVDVAGGDEIGKLAGDINRMLAGLEYAQGELLEGEERFRELAENLDAVFWLIQLEPRQVVYVNPAYERVWGHPRAAMEDDPWAWVMAIHPDDRERMAAASQRALTGEVEYRIVRGDGEVRWIRNRVVPVRDESGEVYRLAGIAEDITERRATDDQLRRERDFGTSLVQTLPAFFVALDAHGCVTLANEALLAAVGHGPEVPVGRDATEFLVEEDQEAAAAVLRELRSSSRPRTVELRVKARDGRQIPTEWHMRAMTSPQGEVDLLFGVGVDLTERRRAEQERQALTARIERSQRLESLALLAGGIAHDFNNLLMGVMGHASLLEEQLPRESDLAESARQIGVAADRAAGLANQMLTYSGRALVAPKPLDLARLVREVTGLVRTSIPRNVAIRFELGEDLPPVAGDSGQLGQLVLNLITNAAEAIGDQHGEITLRTQVMQAGEQALRAAGVEADLAPGRYVLLDVLDTGPGMDEATRSRVFEPFFTTRFTGRGLGLAAALGIARGHGGTITVESAPGRGARFTALLPAQEAPEAQPTTPPPDSQWEARGTVLVVDDEELVRDVTRNILEQSGFAVLTAESGREGVETFRAQAATIDAVVLDMMMPDMGGEEVYAEIRSIRPGAPIVVSSGYTREDVTSRLASEGPVTFVQKPYQPAALTAALRAVLEGEGLK